MLENPIYDRTKIVIKEENVKKLSTLHVTVCGIGGVGSFALEALARIGVGELTLIDQDIVDPTNCNRQLIALQSTISMPKVEVASNRVKDINPNCVLHPIQATITSGNIQDMIPKCDYVVDCVDNIEAKLSIISYCQKQQIRCISSMGMANKLNPLDIRVSDISKTNTCPLAKKIRKELKERGMYHQKVVFSTEIVPKRSEEEKEKYGNTLGSVSFVPSTAGLILASEVIKDIIH